MGKAPQRKRGSEYFYIFDAQSILYVSASLSNGLPLSAYKKGNGVFSR
jgi:hypothetical protein